MLKVMIVGQKWLGAEVLRMCLGRADTDVVAVSAPSLADRMAAMAADADIPLCQVPARLDSRWVPGGLDVIVCAHAHVFIDASARAKARFGAIGYHPSLLPRHRGRDAVHWTVHMRDTVAGGSVYWLDDGADTGPIAAQDWCWVQAGDTPEALWRRDLAPMGLRLIGRVLDDLAAGVVRRDPQPVGQATWEPAWRPKRLAG